MATYDDLAKRLNEAAQQKENHANDLLNVAEEFTRQVERVWQSGGKIQFGRLTEDEKFIAGQIGALNDGQISEFVLAVQFEVSSVPRLQKFPVTVRKTRTDVQMSADGINVHVVDPNQPASFHQVINDLQSVAYQWVDGEVKRSRI